MRFILLSLNSYKETKLKKSIAFFTSLNKDSLKRLQQANDYYDKIPKIVMGSSGKSLAKHRNDLVKATLIADAKLFHQHKQHYQQDIRKNVDLKWYEAQHAKLNCPELWQQLESKLTNKIQQKKLGQLQHWWTAQARFATHSSIGLLRIANQVLPVFNNYLKLLKLEFRYYGHKLSPALQKQIVAYMNQLAAQLAQERHDLITAMLARLKVASDNCDISCDDVIVATLLELQNLNLLAVDENFTSHQRYQLTPETFIAFYRYIQDYGTTTQKRALLQLRWFQQPDYIILSQHQYKIIVPRSLNQTLEKANWWQQLTGSSIKKNKHYLGKNFGLLVALQNLPNPLKRFTRLADFTNNSHWQQLQHLTQQVAVEMNQAAVNKSNNFIKIWLRAGHNYFLTAWQHYLRHQHRKLLLMKINYAAYIAHQLQSRCYFNTDQSLLCNPLFQTALRQFNEDILAHIHTCDQAEIYLEQYSYCHLQFKRVFTLSKPSKNAAQSHTTAPDPAAKNNDHTDHSTALQRLKKIQSLLTQLTLAKRYEFNSQEFIEQVKNLTVHLSLFPQDYKDRLVACASIYKSSVKIFKIYLDSWLDCPKQLKLSYIKGFKQLEKILVAIAPEFIQDRLQQLIALRRQENWFLFQIKCQSFKASLADSNNEQLTFVKVFDAQADDKKLSLSGPNSSLGHKMVLY